LQYRNSIILIYLYTGEVLIPFRIRFRIEEKKTKAMTDSLGQLLALRQLEKAYCAEFMPEERAIYAEAGLPDPFGLPPPVQAKKK